MFVTTVDLPNRAERRWRCCCRCWGFWAVVVARSWDSLLRRRLFFFVWMSVVSVPKLWMHYLVGVSHFAKYGTNRLLIVWKLRKQRNANKSLKIAFFSVVKKMKKNDPESTRSSGSPPKVNHFYSVISFACLSSLADVCFCVRQLSSVQNERTNEKWQRTIT